MDTSTFKLITNFRRQDIFDDVIKSTENHIHAFERVMNQLCKIFNTVGEIVTTEDLRNIQDLQRLYLLYDRTILDANHIGRNTIDVRTRCSSDMWLLVGVHGYDTNDVLRYNLEKFQDSVHKSFNPYIGYDVCVKVIRMLYDKAAKGFLDWNHSCNNQFHEDDWVFLIRKVKSIISELDDYYYINRTIIQYYCDKEAGKWDTLDKKAWKWLLGNLPDELPLKSFSECLDKDFTNSDKDDKTRFANEWLHDLDTRRSFRDPIYFNVHQYGE